MSHIKLQESLRAVFYTPFYAALERGAYAHEGIEVEFLSAPTPGEAASSLFDGRADVCWGGPMRMMQYIDEHGSGAVVGFAEAVTRDPFYLVGRRPNPDFRFLDLCGVRLGTVAEVPTPWLCLRDDIERAGLDPATLNRIGDRSMSQNVAALEAGELEVVQVFEPFTEELVHRGDGHIWYAAANRGATSYTTLYASRAYAHSNPQVLSAMARGLANTLAWIHATPSDVIAQCVAPYFSDLPLARLASSIERYRGNKVWGRDPVLPMSGFVRLKSALISGGFISQDIAFDSCIDNRPALAAIRSHRVSGQA